MDIDGVWEDALRIGIVLIIAYLLVLWIASVMWAFRDISARTRSAPTQLLALFTLLPFLGIPVYLMLRPKHTLVEEYDHRLEAEALMHEIREQATCPSCRRKIDDDFVACPYCRTTLRSPCDSCGRALASTWVLCPYCAAPRAPAGPPQSRASLSQPEQPTIEVERKSRPRRPASTATYTPSASSASPSAPGDATVDSPT